MPPGALYFRNVKRGELFVGWDFIRTRFLRNEYIYIGLNKFQPYQVGRGDYFMEGLLLEAIRLNHDFWGKFCKNILFSVFFNFLCF